MELIDHFVTRETFNSLAVTLKSTLLKPTFPLLESPLLKIRIQRTSATQRFISSNNFSRRNFPKYDTLELWPISTGSTGHEIDCDSRGQRVRKDVDKNRPTAECTQEPVPFFLSFFLYFWLSFALSSTFRILHPIVNARARATILSLSLSVLLFSTLVTRIPDNARCTSGPMQTRPIHWATCSYIGGGDVEQKRAERSVTDASL